MLHLLLLALHHIEMTGLDQNRFTIANSFQQLLILLLFVDNSFLATEVLSLLSNLLLHNIIFSQFSQLLLEHQLVILICHEGFDLLLTSFKFHHDLPVPHLHSLTIIALA